MSFPSRGYSFSHALAHLCLVAVFSRSLPFPDAHVSDRPATPLPSGVILI